MSWSRGQTPAYGEKEGGVLPEQMQSRGVSRTAPEKITNSYSSMGGGACDSCFKNAILRVRCRLTLQRFYKEESGVVGRSVLLLRMG